MMRSAMVACAILVAVVPQVAWGTTEFSKQTMLSCSACHTATMRLTPLGQGFQHSGYRLMRLTKNGSPAFAIRGQAAYSSQPDSTGLPKLIMDEVDYLVAGQIADNFSYFSEVYGLDGGRPGSTREAWIEYASLHQRSPHALRLTAGLVTLPLPQEPEAFRDTSEHYAVWDQTVGPNTFTFFDPHTALWFGYGNPVHGSNISVLAVQARDPGSDLHSAGWDRMVALQHHAGSAAFELYRYDGNRPTGTVQDAFWRQGFGASLYAGRLTLTLTAQQGMDSSPSGNGIAAASNGGFLQSRYQLGSRSYAIMRYDTAEDQLSAGIHALTVGAGTSLGDHFRFELEDVVSHGPPTNHTLNAVFGFGFSNANGAQAY